MLEIQVENIADALNRYPTLIIAYYARDRLCSRTYADLLNDVNFAKVRLQGMGIRSGMRIGILADNEYSWVVLDLALISMRCVSVSFPTGHFKFRNLDELATEYGLQFLFAGESYMPKAGPSWIAPMGAVCAQGVEAGTFRARSPIGPAAADTIEEGVFALTFSSGTSGKLKCLKICYAGLNAFLDACADRVALLEGDSLLVFLPLSGFPQRELVYASIINGISFAVCSPFQMFLALSDFKPTILAAPPAVYELVESSLRKYVRNSGECTNDGDFRAMVKRAISSADSPSLRSTLDLGGRLRIAITCAAPSRLSTLTLFNKTLGIPLLQCYGLTETGYLTCNWPDANRIGTVGKELFPGSLKIAADGELLYSPKTPVALGYFGCSSEETRKTFCDDGLIATGDIVEIDSDGYYRIVGRKKNVIVLQTGVKVQPEELEEVLKTNSLIKGAAIFGGGEVSVITAVVSLGDDDSEECRKSIREFVELGNGVRAPECGIGRLVFTSELFTVDNGLLNRAEKLNRTAIYQRFIAPIVSRGCG